MGLESEIAEISDANGVVLSVLDRKILAMALRGASIAEIANTTGVEPARVRSYLRAQNAPQLQRAFQHILDSKGLSASNLADVAAEAIKCEKPMWNARDGNFEMYPDWNARVSTWKHLTKLHGLDPSTNGHQAGGIPQLRVTINANLGDGDVKDSSNPDRMTIEVSALEAKDVSAAQKKSLQSEIPARRS